MANHGRKMMARSRILLEAATEDGEGEVAAEEIVVDIVDFFIGKDCIPAIRFT